MNSNDMDIEELHERKIELEWKIEDCVDHGERPSDLWNEYRAITQEIEKRERHVST